MNNAMKMNAAMNTVFEGSFGMPEAYEEWMKEDADLDMEIALDPYDRPDFEYRMLTPGIEEPRYGWDAQAKKACPCCGAETLPVYAKTGFTCPLCRWELDDQTIEDSYDKVGTDELGLFEARLNFSAFGICDPSLLWGAEEA